GLSLLTILFLLPIRRPPPPPLFPYTTLFRSDLGGELVVKQFPSGHSNLTYSVSLGEKEMVLRRPPFGSKVKSAHDMGREYNVLRSEEHTSELQSHLNLVCSLLLEKKKRSILL